MLMYTVEVLFPFEVGLMSRASGRVLWMTGVAVNI